MVEARERNLSQDGNGRTCYAAAPLRVRKGGRGSGGRPGAAGPRENPSLTYSWPLDRIRFEQFSGASGGPAGPRETPSHTNSWPLEGSASNNSGGRIMPPPPPLLRHPRPPSTALRVLGWTNPALCWTRPGARLDKAGG